MKDEFRGPAGDVCYTACSAVVDLYCEVDV